MTGSGWRWQDLRSFREMLCGFGWARDERWSRRGWPALRLRRFVVRTGPGRECEVLRLREGADDVADQVAVVRGREGRGWREDLVARVAVAVAKATVAVGSGGEHVVVA